MKSQAVERAPVDWLPLISCSGSTCIHAKLDEIECRVIRMRRVVVGSSGPAVYLAGQRRACLSILKSN